jgi:hypothetical protein
MAIRAYGGDPFARPDATGDGDLLRTRGREIGLPRAVDGEVAQGGTGASAHALGGLENAVVQFRDSRRCRSRGRQACQQVATQDGDPKLIQTAVDRPRNCVSYRTDSPGFSAVASVFGARANVNRGKETRLMPIAQRDGQ